MEEQTAKERIDHLIKEINRHNYQYYILDNPTISDYDFDQLLQELIDLKAQNKTVRQIADETGFSPTTVHRKLKKAEKLGYQPSVTGSVPSQDGEEQAEQVEQHLPFKDD